jgi:hypothetical protein
MAAEPNIPMQLGLCGSTSRVGRNGHPRSFHRCRRQEPTLQCQKGNETQRARSAGFTSVSVLTRPGSPWGRGLAGRAAYTQRTVH